jgi:hypothetical protein
VDTRNRRRAHASHCARAEVVGRKDESVRRALKRWLARSPTMCTGPTQILTSSWSARLRRAWPRLRLLRDRTEQTTANVSAALSAGSRADRSLITMTERSGPVARDAQLPPTLSPGQPCARARAQATLASRGSWRRIQARTAQLSARPLNLDGPARGRGLSLESVSNWLGAKRWS